MTSIVRAVLRSSSAAAAVRKRIAGEASRHHVMQYATRFYSSSNAPSKNPFEIHFHPDDEAKIFNRTPQSPTKTSALTPQEAEIRDGIHLLHAGELVLLAGRVEMTGIFGEEPEEYDSGSSSGSDDYSSKKEQSQKPQPAADWPLESGFPSAATSQNRPAGHAPSRTSIPQTRNTQAQYKLDEPHILVLQGPCCYVGDMMVGSNTPKHQFLGEIHSATAQLGAAVTCRDSNHEGEILDWLLSADTRSAIVLCWNARLSDSPMIVRALELLDSHAVAVIVVSPLGVEHGPLPASVRGVISGLDANAVEIALHAASAIAR